MSDLPAERLAGCFLEWQRIEDEKAKLSEQSKDLFKAMKAEGYDTKAARVSFREKRFELDATTDEVAKAKENEAILDQYRAALTNGLKARARPAPAREKTLKNSASSELTDTQEQPETDEPCDCSERVKPGEYYHCPKCDTEWFPEEDNSPSPETPQATADEEASPPAASSAPNPHPQPNLLPGAVKAPEAGTPPPASGAALSEKKDCLKLRNGHCKISFETSALCSECNRAKAEKARAA